MFAMPYHQINKAKKSSVFQRLLDDARSEYILLSEDDDTVFRQYRVLVTQLFFNTRSHKNQAVGYTSNIYYAMDTVRGDASFSMLAKTRSF